MKRHAHEGRNGWRARGSTSGETSNNRLTGAEGTLCGEMHKVADEPPWSREREDIVLSARASMHLEKIRTGSQGDRLSTGARAPSEPPSSGEASFHENRGSKGTGNGPEWEGEARPVYDGKMPAILLVLEARAHTLRAGPAGECLIGPKD